MVRAFEGAGAGGRGEPGSVRAPRLTSALRARKPRDLVPSKRPTQVRHRPSGFEHDRLVLVHVVHEEDPRRQRGQDLSACARSNVAPAAALRQPVEHPGLVALGLQAPEEPGPGVRERLVIQVHRILRGDDDAEPGRRAPASAASAAAPWTAGWRPAADSRRPRPCRGSRASSTCRAARGPTTTTSVSRSDVTNIRSASARCAIEMIDTRGRPSAVKSRPPDVERIALQPGVEAWEPRAGRSAASRARTDPSPGRTSRGRARRSASPAAAARRRRCPSIVRSRPARHAFPRSVEMSACSRLFSGSASMPTSDSRLVAARGFRSPSASASSRTAAGGAANDLQNREAAARPAARRVDENSTADRRRSMRAASCPHSARPFVQRSASAAANASGVEPFRRRLVLGDPRTEFVGRQVRKRQQQVGDVTLRIDRDRRNAVDRRFLEQRQAQPRLAAARHAETDGMGHEIAGIVENRPVGRRLLSRSYSRPR